MNRLTGSRFYSVLITITDYILLGILWLVTSLPILTIGVTSSAVLSVLHQWDSLAQALFSEVILEQSDINYWLVSLMVSFMF